MRTRFEWWGKVSEKAASPQQVLLELLCLPPLSALCRGSVSWWLAFSSVQSLTLKVGVSPESDIQSILNFANLSSWSDANISPSLHSQMTWQDSSLCCLFVDDCHNFPTCLPVCGLPPNNQSSLNLMPRVFRKCRLTSENTLLVSTTCYFQSIWVQPEMHKQQPFSCPSRTNLEPLVGAQTAVLFHT